MGQLETTQLVRLRAIDIECYSFTHDKVGELIDLVTKMPDEDASHDRGHK